MGRSESIRAADTAALLRVAGDAWDVSDAAPSTQRRGVVLAGLREVIGASSALMFQLRPGGTGPGGFAAPDSVQFDGLDAGGERLFREYMVSGACLDPNAPTMLALPERCVTRHRRQLLSDADWYCSDHYDGIRKPTATDDQLYSKLYLPDGSMIGVGLQRDRGDRPFTDGDGALIDLFHRHMSRLYESRPTLIQMPAERLPELKPLGSYDHGLPPRLRPVLRHLLDGDAEKQVARKLGLSPHTIHQYVKVLYRTFEVSSRGELLARCLGSGRGAPEPLSLTFQTDRT